MSTRSIHSPYPPTSIRSLPTIRSTFDSERKTLPAPSYNPFDGAAALTAEDGTENDTGKRTPNPRKTRTFFERYRDMHMAVSWILGFKEPYSLPGLIIFGGALIGFCLARSFMMSPENLRTKTVPGEWFWYRQSLYKPCIFIHVYLSIISGIFAVFQFLPVIRRRSMILHRINGYMTLLLLIPSTICGSIVARRAFGGELNLQSSFYTLGLLIVSCAGMGLRNVRQTRKHRKWMLRTVTYAAAPITARLAEVSSRRIISDIGSYYSVWRCEEILFVIGQAAGNQSYPQCVQPGDPSNVRVPVRALLAKNDPLGYGSAVRVTFGMALWIAILIHTIAIEFYIRYSDGSNQFRRGFVLERYDEESDTKKELDDH